MNQYRTAYHTDIGTTKKTNQDALLIKKAKTLYGEVLLAVICDGMGGLEKGEVASGEVILTFSRWFEQRLPGLLAGGLTDDIMWREWNELVVSENEKIKQYGSRCSVSLGTTITAMLFANGKYYIVHVGDSRAYYIGNTITQITEDQTVIAREIARGVLTPEQAKTDPRRSVLLQCVGASANVAPAFFSGNIEQGANYLLCCDGFRHEVTPDEIYMCLNSSVAGEENSMKAGLARLVEENKVRQERDNISAILIHAE